MAVLANTAGYFYIITGNTDYSSVFLEIAAIKTAAVQPQ
jgi:hypothetical protein